MNPLYSSSLHVEKVAAATFSRVSRLLLLAPLPGSKSRKVRKPEGFHPFRRTCRRSRMERQGLRPLTIPGFLTVCHRRASPGGVFRLYYKSRIL